MTQPSIVRLNFLRGGYLLLVIGLGLTIWPSILDGQSFELQRGIVVCMLASLSALSVLGLRYPLRMLPLLFFEMAWKSIWLLRIALPLWYTNRLEAAAAEMVFACSIAIVFPFLVPWSYGWDTYLIEHAEPWRRRSANQVARSSL